MRVLALPVILLAAFTFSSLFLGHLIYPAAPLLQPLPHSQPAEQHHELLSNYHRRIVLSIATSSFVLATSLRTMIMTPLLRLESNGAMLPCRKRCSGLLSSIVHRTDAIIDGMERFSHNVWEDAAIQSGVLRREKDDDDDNGPHHNVPEIDAVPTGLSGKMTGADAHSSQVYLFLPCSLDKICAATLRRCSAGASVT